MRRYLLRRLGLLLITLWLMSLAIFTVVQILPGDVAKVILGQYATPGDVAVLRQQYGLDHPLPILYLRWIGGFVTGRWGEAHSYDPCGAVNPPPYFPTTGRFTESRYYEIDPVWLGAMTVSTYFQRLRAQ